MTDIQRMRYLIACLNKASKQYYNGQPSGLTDSQWDAFFCELVELERNTGVTLSGSPTVTVGSAILDKEREVDLSAHPMLSLKKVHTAEEILNFYPGQLLIVMVKCDGLSTRLWYEDGKLVKASTRGDGMTGLDVTMHVKRFTNVPVRINYKGKLIVDGESIIYKKDFEEINVNGEFKNPRNLAAGTLNSLDANLSWQRKLSFIAWDVVEGFYDMSTLTQRLDELEAQGFSVVPWASSCRKPPDEVDEDNDWIMNFAAATIPCDGVVWRLDDIAFGEAQGATEHHRNYAVAWKPPISSHKTYLRDIEWSMGRTGVLTPVAVFDAVDIDGATITRANIHNLDIMDSLLGETPYNGQMLFIYKANEIIPQIQWADIAPENIDHKQVFIVPETCPICGGETIVITSADGCNALYCNNPECQGKLSTRINHFFGKKGLNVKGISTATINFLIDKGWVNDILDMFNLQQYKDEWVAAPGFGAKSVDNMLAALEEGKKTTFAQFLPAIGIPLIGKSASKEILKYFSTYEEFRNAVRSNFDFSKLDNFSYAKTEKIMNFDYTEADKLALVLDMSAADKVEESQAPQALSNKIICITGKLTHYKNRDLFISDVEAHGGKCTSSVSAKTSILVTNDPGSGTAKNVAAKKFGIPIMTEDEFIKKFFQ